MNTKSHSGSTCSRGHGPSKGCSGCRTPVFCGNALTHSQSKHLLSSCSEPEMVLDAKDIGTNGPVPGNGHYFTFPGKKTTKEPTRKLAVGCCRASFTVSSGLSVEPRESWPLGFFMYFQHSQVATLMFGSAQSILERGLVGTRTQSQFSGGEEQVSFWKRKCAKWTVPTSDTSWCWVSSLLQLLLPSSLVFVTIFWNIPS